MNANLLRKIIQKIILEGPVKDAFEEQWFNTEEDREEWDDYDQLGTNHRDMIRKRTDWRFSEEEIDRLFRQKRELKSLWNQMVDSSGARAFWQGPKMQYFHSLTYYVTSDSLFGDDTLQTSKWEDGGIKNLSISAFFNEYKMAGNKDEMSTWGIYNKRKGPGMTIENLGVMLRGRVTLASSADAWVESRSKSTAEDRKLHKPSGMPKRTMPAQKNVADLVFDESDLIATRKGGTPPPGECILDNWSIEAIVYNPNRYSKSDGDALKAFAESKGISLLRSQDCWNKK